MNIVVDYYKKDGRIYVLAASRRNPNTIRYELYYTDYRLMNFRAIIFWISIIDGVTQDVFRHLVDSPVENYHYVLMPEPSWRGYAQPYIRNNLDTPNHISGSIEIIRDYTGQVITRRIR